MTSELVLRTHREVFYSALLHQDWDALAKLYASEYMLVRSDGSVLSKDAVLEELRENKLIFESIELADEQVRIVGPIAILTGSSLTKARHAGTLRESRFRLVAVYVETSDGLQLVHFQSTGLS